MNRTPRLSRSAIEYLDYVWNFESGCTKDCVACYAKKIVTRFPAHYPNGFEPTLYPEAFTSPMRLKKPSIIGVAFMGDLFDSMVDPEYDHVATMPSGNASIRMSLKGWIETTIKECPQHRFLFLTKQSQNLIKWSPFPDNCWVGVSATDDKMAWDALVALQNIKAKVKYISFEPLLGTMSPQTIGIIKGALRAIGLSWVIIGAQTKPTVMPKVEWVREIVEAADKAGVPVFLKNSLWPLLTPKHGIPVPWARGKDGADADILRQEMPA